MTNSEYILEVLKAHKQRDEKKINSIIKELIEKYEQKGQHKYAKELRSIYSFPSTSTLGSSNFTPSSNVSNKERLFEIRYSKVNFSNIVLSHQNKKIVNELSNNYAHREVFKKSNIPYDSKILLYGPPGTGKTLFAYCLAGQLQIPVFHVYLDGLISSYLGSTGKNIHNVFEEASNMECILFLDEFDALAKKRDDNQELGELKRVVTVLLQNFDDFNSNNILIAATNHDHLLDRAIRRRFTYELNLNYLDYDARKELLKVYTEKFPIKDYDLIAAITESLSGSKIKSILDRALRNWILISKNENLNDLVVDAYIQNFIASFRNEEKVFTDKDLLKRVIDKLRVIDKKKYTFKNLEKLLGIPDSTISNLVTNKL